MATTLPAGLRLREQDLVGKVAVITGASRGIGRAIALNLASRGCSILGTCSSTQSLHLVDSLAQHITELYAANPQSAPRILGVDANILNVTAATTIANAVQTHFEGHADIFVNNASDPTPQRIGELTDEVVRNSLTANIHVPVMIVEEFVRRKFFRPNSRIIYISSVRARKAWADQSMYMATKAGGEALCRSWADAFGGKYPHYEFMAGTTANAVMVGITRTDAVYHSGLDAELIKSLEDEFVPHQGIPRVGNPEDVADVVGLLCREEARWITGSVVGADGGGLKIL